MITTVSSVIDAPVADVWALLKFGNWGSWLKGRTLTLEDGAEQGAVGSVRVVSSEGSAEDIRERLLMQDDVRHTLTYTFDGPTRFPCRSYVSTVRLDPITTTGGTFIHWSAAMDADAADEQVLDATISGIYTMFIETIAATLGA